MRIDDRGDRLEAVVSPTAATRLIMAASFVIVFAVALALTVVLVGLVRTDLTLVPVGGLLAAVALVLISWIGVGSGLVQVLGRRLLTIDESLLSIEHQVAGRRLWSTCLSLSPTTTLVEPPKPPFLSMRAPSANVLVLSDNREAGISRNILSRKDAAVLAPKLNDFLNRQRAV